MKTSSRRNFFNNIVLLLTLPFSWLWYSSVTKSAEVFSQAQTTIIDDDIPNGISFRDEFIFLKQNSSIKIFSSKCSHLGCRITSTERNELVCPCHGSRYDFTGKVVKGPAQNPLRQLRFKREKDKIIIYES